MMAAWTRRRGWLLAGCCMACPLLLAETGAMRRNPPSELASELPVGDKPPAIKRWVATQQDPRDATITRWGTEAGTGLSRVVRVDDAALLWTGLLSPRDESDQLLNPGDPVGQTRAIIRQLRWLLEATGSSLDRLLRLNVYAASPHVIPLVEAELSRSLAAHPPVATFVAGHLPGEGILVTMDAVAALDRSAAQFPVVRHSAVYTPPGQTSAMILPAGEVLFLAGAVGQADLSPAEAIAHALHKQIELVIKLGSSADRIVQIRAFADLTSPPDMLYEQVGKVFADQPHLPAVVVAPWGRPGAPEIEVIAAGGPGFPVEPGWIEYHEPTGKVFSRATRVNSRSFLFFAGMVSSEAGEAGMQASNIFEQLEYWLKQSSSDFRHLAKATYWLADRPATEALRNLRLQRYDPTRPPSASGFLAENIGYEGRCMNLDWIAIPATGGGLTR
jgi:enamine deaminase RidA (YjgF/YER057c/UK114 family)